jgi:hypothetical protein
VRHGWQSAYPLDWCVAQCPVEEMAPLHDYEYSRESSWIQQQVDFIRHGQIPAPTYWSPLPSFGWSEWSLQGYLSVPGDERKRRVQSLAATNYDELRALSVRPPIAGPPPSGRVIPVYLDAELSPHEQYEALLALLRVEHRDGGYAKGRRRRAQGRASTVARRFDRVRALSAARLLQLYSAAEALARMNEAHGQIVFSDVTSLRRSANRAHAYLDEFILLAKRQISRGLWPPPFGNTLVEL